MQPTESFRAPPPGERADSVRVLVVDDEVVFARAVAKQLGRAGMHCDVASSLSQARADIAQTRPDLIVLDMRLPDGSGLDLLAALESDPGEQIPVVVLTAFGDLGDAVSAMKQRAVDYLTKPIDLDELLAKLEKILAQAQLSRRLIYSQERESHSLEQHPMLGTSSAMQRLRGQVERVQSLAQSGDDTPPTVLILGDTGTGKDLCARTLHVGSARREAPFVHLDCASLPKSLIESELFGHEKGAFTGAHAARSGLIEAAEHGTLFLDEIGELPLDVQSRLLAVLERRSVRRVGQTRERAVHAWFMAATNRNLETMVSNGTFRSDLFYRLNVLTIVIPPLRERRQDVITLAEYYAERTARRYGLKVPHFNGDARELMTNYDWPGNVRELIHIIERAMLLSGQSFIGADDLDLKPRPVLIGESRSGQAVDGLTLDEAERTLIVQALKRSAGNVSQAARELGLTRMALRYRLNKHAIDPKQRD